MEKMLKLLHVSTPLSWRGGEQQAFYLFKDLNDLGANQFLLTPPGSIFGDRASTEGWNVLYEKKRSGVDPFFARRIAKICKDHDIDLIHVHDSHALTLSVLSHFLFGNKSRIVIHRRVDYALHSGVLSRWKYNHPAVAAILCVSKKVREVMTPFIVDPDKLKVVYDGIDIHRFNGRPSFDIRSEWNVPSDHLLVASVGAISQQKDLFTFIDTVDILRSTETKLSYFIIGDGPQRAEVEAYAKEKVGDQIRFTGFRKDIVEILPQLDILLNTPEMEGLGTTFLDAMAAGVPIVATNTGGIPEIITDNVNGFLAPVRDAETLAKKTLELVKDPELRDRMVVEGKKQVENFTHQETARSTYEIDLSLIREFRS